MASLAIHISGFTEDQAQAVGHVLGEIIQAAQIDEYPLDIGRLDRIIVSNDFDHDFKKLAEELGRNITYTQNEYGACVAKVISYRKEEDFGMIMVVRSGLAQVLLSEENSYYKEAYHLIRHELCHVHDFNMKATMLKDEFMRRELSGVEAYIVPMVSTLWDEYFAVRTSSRTAVYQQVADQVDLLLDTLNSIRDIMNKRILAFRLDGDVNALLRDVTPHAIFLLQIASYVAGYLDGGWGRDEGIQEKVNSAINDSFFTSVWENMNVELRQMYESYPKWSGMEIYDGLSRVVETYCELLGWTYEPIPEGVYIRVPMRPETTPPL